MEQLTRRTMAAAPWLLLLCLAVTTGGGVLQARAQPDSQGFLTIDCGLQGETGYVDNVTTLALVPDNGEFTDDAGTCHNISAESITPSMPKSWYNVRSFAAGARNCYTLRSLVPGLKYLIRGKFLYGNYDGLNRPPVFDLHVGVNYWCTVNFSTPNGAIVVEAIVVVPDDIVQVCLINTGTGTPFISGLDLRPLKKTMYPQATKAKSLALFRRVNFGSSVELIRYPDDPHDRFWFSWVKPALWTEMSTTRTPVTIASELFDVPSVVLQTAIRPRNGSQIQFSWEPKPQPNDPSPAYYAIMHFTELQLLPSNALRSFYINLNGELWELRRAFAPPYLYRGVHFNAIEVSGKSQYTVTINATANSTLPPFINALELFSVMPATYIATEFVDASAIREIKAKYHMRTNWMGDPCGPGAVMVWDSLTCSYANGIPPRIRRVDLSSRGLNGDIASSFASLKAIQYLNLSNNNLIGSIPEALSLLASLADLDLSGNQLNGSIPNGLLRRVQEGSLNLRYDNNPDLCTNGTSCQPVKTKRNSRLAMYIAIPAVVIVVITVVTLLCCFIRRKKQGSMNNSVKPQNEMTNSYASGNNVYGGDSLKLENRRFTYGELEMITNNFQQVLGQGGFGKVYNGFLENGTQVAVKVLSHSSGQGFREFQAEAQILTRIHHTNLVSLIGYCKDGECMALVYEYMSEGTVEEHIKGSRNHGGCLAWKQRLRIAHESAQGLEYLHKGCNPPLIHRDVKTANILLNTKMEARIADFGLSKAFKGGSGHISTGTVVGTPGYLDPEYHATFQLTAKSDVYSFGVVLLELVTGKPPILREAEPIGIIQWARQRMALGNIESVVDARMGGVYDVNSVWKVVEIALKCTEHAPPKRPTMSNVVVQLQECIELEEGHVVEDADKDLYSVGSCWNPNSSYDFDTSVSDQSTNMNQNNAAFQMEDNAKRMAARPTGPAAR